MKKYLVFMVALIWLNQACAIVVIPARPVVIPPRPVVVTTKPTVRYVPPVVVPPVIYPVINQWKNEKEKEKK